MAKVLVLEPDRKFLSSRGVYIYPKVGDVVDLEDITVNSEIEVGNVELVDDSEEVTEDVVFQKPSFVSRKSVEQEVEEPALSDDEIDKAAPPPSAPKSKKTVISTRTPRARR